MNFKFAEDQNFELIFSSSQENLSLKSAIMQLNSDDNSVLYNGAIVSKALKLPLECELLFIIKQQQQQNAIEWKISFRFRSLMNKI